MSNIPLRHPHHPYPPDTTGFYQCSVPLSNLGHHPLPGIWKVYYYPGMYDYIDAAKEKEAPVAAPSLFAHHALPARNFTLRPIHKQSSDWVVALLFVGLIFFAWIQTLYSKRLAQIIKAALQPYFLNQLEREGDLVTERINYGLSVIYAISASLLIVLSARVLGIPYFYKSFAFSVVALMVALLLFRLFKAVLIHLSGFVFEMQGVARNFRIIELLFSNIAGLLLMPLVVLLYFWQMPAIIYISGIIVLILFVVRLVRLFLSGMANGSYNLFYLFLYLCTLEILPVLLLIKAMQFYLKNAA